MKICELFSLRWNEKKLLTLMKQKQYLEQRMYMGEASLFYTFFA